MKTVNIIGVGVVVLFLGGMAWLWFSGFFDDEEPVVGGPTARAGEEPVAATPPLLMSVPVVPAATGVTPMSAREPLDARQLTVLP